MEPRPSGRGFRSFFNKLLETTPRPATDGTSDAHSFLMARMIGEEAPREVSCPRCGADASWRFLDEAKITVEILCPDCGIFELPRRHFEKAEADVAGMEDR